MPSRKSIMEADDEEQPLLHDHRAVWSPKKIGAGNWRACVLILVTELSECLAFAGIARNLVTYLTGMLHESNVAAVADASTWAGTCFLTPLLGAFLADSYWGRYKTIVVFLSVYTLGMITLSLSASLLPTVAFLGLYLVALGVGGIKPCVSPFGAEQFDEVEPGERDAMASFFNWYYFCVNIGSLVGSTVLVWVQELVSWWLGFGIPATVMTIALIIFVSSKRWLSLELPDDCSLLHHKLPYAGNSYMIEHTDEFRFLDKAAVVVSLSPASSCSSNILTSSCSSSSLCTVTQVEEVKMLLRLCSVWPTVVFFFAAVTTQMSTTFLEQGTVMDSRIRPFTVPPATVSSIEVVSVLLCVPVYEAVLLPLACRITGKERGLTLLQRLGVGLALATLTMAYMAVLEMKRLQAASPVSIIWQAPAYFVLGAAEVFTSVGLIKFYYDQSPDAMKSLCTSVSLVAVAAGNYLNSVIITAVAWATTRIPQDLNQGRLDCFWMMAVLSNVNMLAFLWSSMRYTYREKC